MDAQSQFKQDKTKKTFYDLTYKKFGDLTVQYRAEENYTTANFAEPMWVCRCGCGNYVTVRGSKLRNGEQKTCGNCVKNLKVNLAEYHFDKSIRNERTALTYLKRNLHNEALEDKISAEEKQRIHDLKMQWMVFWRKNINLYIHYKMGVNSFPYQHYGYYQMQEATDFFEISTRGTSKTAKAVWYSVAKCLLYAGTKVGVGAVTKSQAEQDFNETFVQELVGRFSWLLKFLERFDKITWRTGDKGPEVYFWNGSSIIFFPVIDSSRGSHVDTLILEECRLMKKKDIDSIALPMLIQRQPAYKSLPEYSTRRDLDEPVQTIYITSNRFANEWFFTLYKKFFVNQFKDTLNKYCVFNVDIFLGLRWGLRSYQWFLAQSKMMTELNYRMELLNETCGEAEDAYYSLDMFQQNRVLKNRFVPPTIEQIVKGEFKFSKQENEYRFVTIDFAFSDSIQNDTANTIIACGAVIKTNGTWIKRLDYMESYSGGKQRDESLLRIRELYFWYEADWVIYDNRNGGTVNFTDLTKPFDHPNLPSDLWNSHGFTIAHEDYLQMMSRPRLNELAERTVDPDAIPCMIPISATLQFNSDGWIDLNKRLRQQEIEFLMDDLEFQMEMEGKSTLKMTNEEKTLLINGYVQTSLMISEAVGLEQSWNNGLLVLKEPSRLFKKDRIIVVMYFNSIANKLINVIDKQDLRDDDDIDFDNFQLVF